MTTATESNSRLGVGLYSIAEAARLSGAHAETVRRWISEKDGIVPRQYPAAENLVGFQKLMEIHFVQLFRAEGVSFQAIRKASNVAARQFQTNYPFTVKRFDTDGRTIFATLANDDKNGELTQDLVRGQLVFRSIMRPFLRKLEYDGPDETVSKFWPRSRQGRVVLDPLRKFGKPIDAESGISTSAIYEAVLAGGGQSPAVVAKWLDIPAAAVHAAVAFERSLAA